jgi:hypothetical protein
VLADDGTIHEWAGIPESTSASAERRPPSRVGRRRGP